MQVIDEHGRAGGVAGGMGRIAGARLLPMGGPWAPLDEIDHGRPMVTVCRSGVCSAQAPVLLGSAGFAEVAKSAGGMLAWRTRCLPTKGAQE